MLVSRASAPPLARGRLGIAYHPLPSHCITSVRSWPAMPALVEPTTHALFGETESTSSNSGEDPGARMFTEDHATPSQ